MIRYAQFYFIVFVVSFLIGADYINNSKPSPSPPLSVSSSSSHHIVAQSTVISTNYDRNTNNQNSSSSSSHNSYEAHVRTTVMDFLLTLMTNVINNSATTAPKTTTPFSVPIQQVSPSTERNVPFCNPGNTLWYRSPIDASQVYVTSSVIFPQCKGNRGSAKVSRKFVLDQWKGKHVMIIGDSLSRYQYLNLAYWLHTGEWVSPLPSNEVEKGFTSWEDFFERTNQRLGGWSYERCDCSRPVTDRTDLGVWQNHRENRWYYNPTLNTRLTYLQQFGQNGVYAHTSEYLAQGSCLPQKCTVPLNEIRNATFSGGILKGKQLWIHMACHTRPQPNVLIINMGLWFNVSSYGYSYEYLRVAAKAIKKCNPLIRLIWKTTTPRQYEMGVIIHDRPIVKDIEFRMHGLWEVTDTAKMLHELGRSTVGVVNVSDVYWDQTHFTPSVYVGLNIGMLRDLWGQGVGDCKFSDCV